MIGGVAHLDHVSIGCIQIIEIQSYKFPGQGWRRRWSGLAWGANCNCGGRRNGIFYLKLRNGLIFASVEELEIFFLEIFHRLALRIAHYYPNDHQIAGCF
jgi:hypothetical protein